MKQFIKHTIESAPEASKDLLKYGEKKYGMLPNLFRYMAGAPAALEGYVNLFNTFSKTSFSGGEQHLVLLAVSITNECDYCTAAHTRAAKANGISSSILNAVRKKRVLEDDRLNTLINTTKKLTETRGNIDAEDLNKFYDAGFSPENIMELIVGISLKTIGNYINHVTENIINDELQPFAVGKEIGD
ncbi:carboxymuconolactone decarboxylase family protein [Flavivirga jejuensis]|uniref:Carboxymuconolactone decarboxylase family protein n=1 Tax=Flavivirga jejuensis TaxID=870487 RepID=A0ABT8WP82_9FLAO|nr:carboxymuconolactone decarboxylase family protein [Flavivirga jejuensis]MDO5974961.1 carboxymuconolactone decarboxylase family protein [Flavivirga jejuensis]